MKFLLVTFFLVFSSINIFAQHCPFDGGNLIVVHLTDSQGKLVSPESKKLTLVEVNNEQADSCTYAQGLLKKPFLPNKENIKTHYEINWKYWIEPNYKDWKLFGNGYYSTILGQAEESCMIKNGNDFAYKKREFEIQYQDQGVTKTVKVAKDSIYSLCTGTGKWTRIVPIEIKVESAKNLKSKYK